ncbi:hypothetical protein [Streptomyces tritici]|uniref:hypothetical protein n=1 Tax=Streptomyces tritici TaxID=2054410 RepID=UPI003AF1BB8A
MSPRRFPRAGRADVACSCRTGAAPSFRTDSPTWTPISCPGLVLDGELVTRETCTGRSFEALQRRAAVRDRTALALAAKRPAFFIAFDALQIHGFELLALPLRGAPPRPGGHLRHPTLPAAWTLCPMTTDRARAQERLEDWTVVSVEARS